MKKIIIASLLCATSLAQAQDQSPTTATLQFTKEAAEVAPRGFIPFLGAGGGYTGYGGGQAGSVEGTPGTLKLLGSYYFESPYVAEIGYGINSQSFTQTSAIDRNITNAAIEVGVRYHWDSRWQAGLIADQLSKQGFNYAANQQDAQFAGVQVLKEFNMSPAWLSRIGARAMTLTNNTGNNVYMYLVDLQIGWNPRASKTSVKSTAESTVQPSEKMAMESVTAAEAAPVLRDISYSSIASRGTIEFSSSRVAVNKKDQEHLTKIAAVLNQHNNLLERVEVVGYADSKGSAVANERISKARAERVKKILQQAGLVNVPITTIGKVESEATAASMKNARRAELVFIGVKDEEALKSALASID